MAKKKDTEPKTKAEAVEEQEAAVEAEVKQAPPETENPVAQLNEANDKLLRTLAEYDNFRRRSQKEKEQAYSDSKALVLAELLPVMDNFERAAGNKEAPLEDYQKGIDMIYTQFSDIFKKMGVEAFGEKGESFDPNLHNAVMHIEDENEEESKIADVFSKGYKLGDKILRPAMVKVVN